MTDGLQIFPGESTVDSPFKKQNKQKKSHIFCVFLKYLIFQGMKYERI